MSSRRSRSFRSARKRAASGRCQEINMRSFRCSLFFNQTNLISSTSRIYQLQDSRPSIDGTLSTCSWGRSSFETFENISQSSLSEDYNPPAPSPPALHFPPPQSTPQHSNSSSIPTPQPSLSTLQLHKLRIATSERGFQSPGK